MKLTRRQLYKKYLEADRKAEKARERSNALCSEWCARRRRPKNFKTCSAKDFDRALKSLSYTKKIEKLLNSKSPIAEWLDSLPKSKA
jgi:hypothetical protein